MLRLIDAPTDSEPTGWRRGRCFYAAGTTSPDRPGHRGDPNGCRADWRPHRPLLTDTGLAPLADTCGRAFLEDRTALSLLELHNALGPQAFDGGRITPKAFHLSPLFRPASPQALAFFHSAYQELLAARYLSTLDVLTTRYGRLVLTALRGRPLTGRDR